MYSHKQLIINHKLAETHYMQDILNIAINQL